MTEEDREHWRAWAEAAQRPELDARLRELLADLDRDVAAGDAVCNMSGRCCRFGEFGHRLYVTGLEIAWFLENLSDVDVDVPAAEASAGVSLHVLQTAARQADTCPHMIDGKCSTHMNRPTGCRVFFCQDGTEGWQNELYETYLNRLRAIHDELGLPYRYMDWMRGLEDGAAATA